MTDSESGLYYGTDSGSEHVRLTRITPGSRRKLEDVPLLSGTSELSGTLNEFSDPQFAGALRSVERAIDHGVLPEIIAQGSSGSYFAKNVQGVSLCRPRGLLKFCSSSRKVISID